jgi:hypothetical protein
MKHLFGGDSSKGSTKEKMDKSSSFQSKNSSAERAPKDLMMMLLARHNHNHSVNVKKKKGGKANVMDELSSLNHL